MNGLMIFAANELMAALTIIIVFPGMLPPEDGFELFAFAAIMLGMSLVWPVFLTLAPIVFLILWLLGDWTPSDHFREWPWRYFQP